MDASQICFRELRWELQSLLLEDQGGDPAAGQNGEPQMSSFFFLGPHPCHMEVHRLGVKSELQMPVYTTATVTPIQAVSITYTTAHVNAGSLSH